MTPTVREIQTIVCDEFKVPLIAMLSQRRGREWSYPRQIAMALSAEMTALSLPSIGRLFGDRDHTTLIHSVRVVKKRCDDDPALAARVNAIRHTAAARATTRQDEAREAAEVRKRYDSPADEPKRNEVTDSLDRKAKADGCRMLLVAMLTTGHHFIADPVEVKRLLAA